MELIDYTNKWLAGEIFEDLAMVIAGIIVFILALLAWRLGSSESARAIVWPLIVAAVLLIGLGGSLAYNNHARKAQYAQQYQENPQQFLDSEKARVDEFMKIYPQTIIVSAVMMVVAICRPEQSVHGHRPHRQQRRRRQRKPVLSQLCERRNG